ncbi:MAG: hypothetical protein WCB11_24545 [Terriglobales bacterium]|jgi:hypothetical protein
MDERLCRDDAVSSFMMIYEGFRLHRFDGTAAILFLVFILPAFRYSRLIYRRLGS